MSLERERSRLARDQDVGAETRFVGQDGRRGRHCKITERAVAVFQARGSFGRWGEIAGCKSSPPFSEQLQIPVRKNAARGKRFGLAARLCLTSGSFDHP